MKVSALGYGGAEIGFEGGTTEIVNRLLNEALDAGLNVIDTASAYLTSEELIGQAVSHRRKDFYLFTKCGATDGFEHADWSRNGIFGHIERSLKALKTDHLDLIQLHSCDETELLKGDVIETLERARDQGYARYIGYSGDRQEALYAVECGRFDVLQTSLSIADQESVELTLPKARERNMGVIAKRPVANAAWRTGEKPVSAYHHTYWERLQKLDYDFLKGDPKEAISTALRFTLSVPGVHTAIVGTTKPGRWRENAEMLEAGPLSKEIFEKMRARWREIADSSWVGQT